MLHRIRGLSSDRLAASFVDSASAIHQAEWWRVVAASATVCDNEMLVAGAFSMAIDDAPDSLDDLVEITASDRKLLGCTVR